MDAAQGSALAGRERADFRPYRVTLASALRARVDATILGYRYWLDEPGNDVRWYFSESHALLFHAAAYLAGARAERLDPRASFYEASRGVRSHCTTLVRQPPASPASARQKGSGATAGGREAAARGTVGPGAGPGREGSAGAPSS
jgi:hypothetical protein